MDDRRKRLSQDEQALHWVEVLRTADADTRVKFAQWIRRSPENLEAFLRQTALTKELEGLRQQVKPDLQALIAQARATNKIVPWPGLAEAPVSRDEAPPLSHPAESDRTPRFRARHWGLGAVAAALVVGIAGVWTYHAQPPSWTVYATVVGEQKKIPLPDGSIIELNTQSSARIDFAGPGYDVYLLAGEALFDVKHNPARPFRVHVGRTLIEDLGTQFNVRRTADLTMVAVSVVEGSVRVSTDKGTEKSATPEKTGEGSNAVVVTGKEFEPLRAPTQIIAGEEVRVVGDGSLMERSRVNVAQTIAWREGRLNFSGATLGEIVAEFNRYNARKIVLYGDSLMSRRYSGVFSAMDPGSFIEYLHQDTGIEVDDRGNELIVRRR